jgi:ribonuclease P protein component
VFSFTKSQRLLKPKQFKRVYRSRYWGNSKHLSFNINPLASQTQDDLAKTRVGITVSKKVSKRAVDRNRIKRQIREFIRYRLDQLLSVDIVITAKPSCATASDKERDESLEALWTKVLAWQRWYQHQDSLPKDN